MEGGRSQQTEENTNDTTAEASVIMLPRNPMEQHMIIEGQQQLDGTMMLRSPNESLTQGLDNLRMKSSVSASGGSQQQQQRPADLTMIIEEESIKKNVSAFLEEEEEEEKRIVSMGKKGSKKVKKATGEISMNPNPHEPPKNYDSSYVSKAFGNLNRRLTEKINQSKERKKRDDEQEIWKLLSPSQLLCSSDIRFYSINVADVELIRHLWGCIKTLDSVNNRFISAMSSLLFWIHKSPETKEALESFKTLITLEEDGDLEGYIKYLLAGKNGVSFGISKIPHKFINVKNNVQNPKKYALLRLAATKFKCSKIILFLLKNLLNIRSYDNKIMWTIMNDVEGVRRVKNYSSMSKKNPFLPGGGEINHERASAFLSAHQVYRAADQSIQNEVTSKYCRFGLEELNLIGGEGHFYIAFSPFLEFLGDSIAEPKKKDFCTRSIFEKSHNGASIRLGTGIWTFRNPISGITIKENVSPMQKESKGNFKQTFMGKERRLLFKEVKVALYNNDASFVENEYLPIKGQVLYYLNDTTMSNRISLLRHEDNIILKNDSHLFSKLNYDLLTEKEEEAATMLLEKSIQENSAAPAYIEPLIAIDNLHQLTTWSMYFKWEAYEGSQHLLALLGLAKYAHTIAANQYKRERQELKFQAQNGNLEAKRIFQQLEREEQRLEATITEVDVEGEDVEGEDVEGHDQQKHQEEEQEEQKEGGPPPPTRETNKLAPPPEFGLFQQREEIILRKEDPNVKGQEEEEEDDDDNLFK